MRLEMGDISVLSFGKQTALVHPFGRPFTDEAAAEVLSRFTFNQDGTDVIAMLSTALSSLDEWRFMHASSNSEQMQILFVISDGRLMNTGFNMTSHH